MGLIILDGKKFTDRKTTHAVLKETLGLPDYYGKNLDALWDCLTGFLGTPVRIMWINYETSERMLGEYADALKETFMEAAEKIDGFEFGVYR